jgi:predicted transcriptional regulator
MLSERLQILVTPEQRRRLQSEARDRGASVGGLVREAIDARYGGFSREERIQAVEEMARAEGGRFVSPDELNRIVEEERDEEFERLHGPRQA